MKKKVEEAIARISKNIEEYGLYRYDPRDIDDIITHINDNSLKSIANRALQLTEVIAPYSIRRVFRCKPRTYPTTYTFIAESQFDSENSIPLAKTADQYMAECIEKYYKGNGYWKYEENKSFYPDKDNTDCPSMPLYMLARCNNILARLGTKEENEYFIKISKESLEYTFDHHNIFTHDDGTENISYYYNSIDNTINVNTEILDWISQIPEIILDIDIYQHFSAILKGVLNEQRSDGSWCYFSYDHMKKYGVAEVIDCHHSATVLYNLIHVFHSVDNSLLDAENLKKSIKKAMSFFTMNFFDSNGYAITVIGKKRKASSVQYSEALIAMIDYLRFVEFDESYDVLVKRIVNNLLMLVESDGSAPGDSKIKPVNINNINWGNGPVLYALTHYLYKYERQ